MAGRYRKGRRGALKRASSYARGSVLRLLSGAVVVATAVAAAQMSLLVRDDSYYSAAMAAQRAGVDVLMCLEGLMGCGADAEESQVEDVVERLREIGALEVEVFYPEDTRSRMAGTDSELGIALQSARIPTIVAARGSHVRRDSVSYALEGSEGVARVQDMDEEQLRLSAQAYGFARIIGMLALLQGLGAVLVVAFMTRSLTRQREQMAREMRLRGAPERIIRRPGMMLGGAAGVLGGAGGSGAAYMLAPWAGLLTAAPTQNMLAWAGGAGLVALAVARLGSRGGRRDISI